MTGARDFDVVVLGATGFTGGHVARWFAANAPKGLRWAVAGRNADKLTRLVADLGVDVPRLVVDVGDDASVDRMAAATRVVCNLAGPYGRYGTPVVRACVRHGTDHTDLTGETPWVRSLVDTVHDDAVKSGARIVSFAGFDSIPSELGAWLVARHCRDTLGQGCGRVDSGFAVSGGVSGGTFASAVDLADPSFGRQLSDPFLLDPPDVRDQRDRRANRDPRDVVYSDDFGEWLGPFFMAPTNTRVVRRSAALLAAAGRSYGEAFAYQEHMRFPSRLRAHAVRLAVGGLFAALRSPATRSLAIRLGPKSGDGPKDVTKGGFRAIFVGRAVDGTRVRAEVKASGDPGYGVTPRLIGAATLLLATERTTLPASGGVLTPAAAFDARLPDLARIADVAFDVATAPEPR